MFWANFLHFYQPPDQRRYMMEKIVNEGYRPLLSTLLKHPQARMTFNISGCLLDRLAEFGMDDVIKSFRLLVERNQVELTASVKYHPFLPLLKQSEIDRQIMINNDTLRYYFKDLYKPVGFFSPEAGYSRQLAKLVSSKGYKWIIADEIAYNGRLSFRTYDFTQTPGFYSGGMELWWIVGNVSGDTKSKIKDQRSKLQRKAQNYVDYTKIYRLETHNLQLTTHNQFYIFFRERIISDAIASGQIQSAEQFLKIIEPELGRATTRVAPTRYLLTGTDGEAYGHHQPGLTKVLDDLLSRQGSTLTQGGTLATITISELFNHFKTVEEVDPLASTWGTSEEEISAGYYYSRWLDPRNKIHKMQWDLTNLAITIVEEAKGRGDPGYPTARKLLDQAVYSCHFWWAAARPWWSIEIIERGSKYLIDVVAAIRGNPKRVKGDKRDNGEWNRFISQKRRATRLYHQIIFTAFDWLRRELVWDLSHTHK